MKTIGIIGGMGPLASADLYQKITRMADAKSDQEHPRIFIDSNSSIPDRTGAILHGGKSPLPALVDSATRLTNMGADLLTMACNTAHYFYDAVAEAAGIPVLHMPRETAAQALRQGYKTVGLLATDGTIQTGIYRDAFAGSCIELVLPDSPGQQAVMAVIYEGIKAGNLALDCSSFLACLDRMRQNGVEAFILGCTELPMAFEIFRVDAPALDPTAVLAAAALRAAGCPIKA